MYVRKMRKKWQCLVRLKGISISQSFCSKSDASRWGKEKEVEILNGTYLYAQKEKLMKAEIDDKINRVTRLFLYLIASTTYSAIIVLWQHLYLTFSMFYQYHEHSVLTYQDNIYKKLVFYREQPPFHVHDEPQHHNKFQ